MLDLDSRLSDPAERRRIVAAVAAELRTGTPPDLLVSSGTEALVLTSLLAGGLRLPMAYLRPKPKEHGRQKRIEGELRGSHAALIAVDDSAIEENTSLLAENGVQVQRVVTPTEGMLHREVPVASQWERPGEGTRASPEDVARILLKVGAVLIRQEPFRYVSGILSPMYTDCRLLISYPEHWLAVIRAFADRLSVQDVSVEAIAGVATSGIPHASLLAQQVGKPLVYVADGRVVGAAPEAGRLVLVEDLVTTGKSVLEAAAALRQHGFKLDRCLSIFTYDRQQPALDAVDIHFEPLSDLETLLRIGVRENYFGESERHAVLDWRCDPQRWTELHEKEARVC